MKLSVLDKYTTGKYPVFSLEVKTKYQVLRLGLACTTCPRLQHCQPAQERRSHRATDHRPPYRDRRSRCYRSSVVCPSSGTPSKLPASHCNSTRVAVIHRELVSFARQTTQLVFSPPSLLLLSLPAGIRPEARRSRDVT